MNYFSAYIIFVVILLIVCGIGWAIDIAKKQKSNVKAPILSNGLSADRNRAIKPRNATL